MKISYPQGGLALYDASLSTPLYEIKPGNVVAILEPNGKTCIYQICRSTDLEGIRVPFDKTMLSNLQTGRIVFKPSHIHTTKLNSVLNL